MLYVIAEEAYSNFTWYQTFFHGIYEQARRKKISIRQAQKIEQIPQEDPTAVVLLLGGTENWFCRAALLLKRHNIPTICCSMVEGPCETLPINFICTDMSEVLHLMLDYFHTLGRDRVALYGINPSSVSDPRVAELFCRFTGRPEDVYYVSKSYSDLFSNFYQNVEKYDGVFCVNDYSALSLVNHLKECGIDPTEQINVIGYGNMCFSRLNHPSITTMSDDFECYGIAAISIYQILMKQRQISSIQIQMHPKLYIRETTGNRPYVATERVYESTEESMSNIFYQDQEVSDMADLEAMLNQCDDTDLMILQHLMKNASYSEIADSCFISESAAKYRVKKMEDGCHVKSRAKLLEHLQFLFG